MVLEAKPVSSTEGVSKAEDSPLAAMTLRPGLCIKAELCSALNLPRGPGSSTASSSAESSPISPVTTAETDSESDTEQANEAASILSSVVSSKPPSSPSPPVVSPPPSAQYEDLLDCLASLASGRAPLEPLDRCVARMSVDDIDVRSNNARTSTPSPTAPMTPMDEPSSAPLPGPQRQRAVSNPEGCEVWRRMEMVAPRPVPSSSSAGSAVGPTLPHMLAKYASLYNKGGRIGIYTREERDAIIRRFREKKARRVWAKKIRYTCRKSLADKRIRVKGRFVKLEDMEALLLTQQTQQQQKPKPLHHNVGGKGALDVLTMIAEQDDDEGMGMGEEEEEEEEEERAPPAGKRMRRHSIAF